MKVHEVMTAHARCVGPDNMLVEAAGLMRELDVGALPVCENDRLAGMVTDRDMVLRGTADGRDPNTTPVRDVMSPRVVYVFADQDVEEAARLMEEKQIRRLPILNREKRLVGILSLGDIATSSNPAFSGMALREVSEPSQPSARQQRLARASEPTRRSMPEVPGARRGPGGARKQGGRRGSGRRRGATQAKTSGTRSSGAQRKQTKSRSTRKTRGRATSSGRGGARKSGSRSAR